MDLREFRSEQPLSDEDFARIRREVLARTSAKPRIGLAFRLAFATLVVALVMILWPRREATVQPIHTTPQVITKAQPVAPVITHTQQQPPAVVATVRKTPHHHRRHHDAPPQQLAMRMELQTSDPDIRIIWITN